MGAERVIGRKGDWEIKTEEFPSWEGYGVG